MSTSAVPVLLCGRTASIAEEVCRTLLPRFQVLHTYLDVGSARQGVDALLSAKRDVAAVIFGGAFSPEEVRLIRQSSIPHGAAQQTYAIKFLVPDRKIKVRNSPFIKGGEQAYGREVGERVLGVLDRLHSQGLLTTSGGGGSGNDTILY